MAVRAVPAPRRRRRHHLDVHTLPVCLIDVDGESREAAFFLHVPGTTFASSGTLGNRLNEPGVEFLPCCYGKRTVLQRLDQIATIELRKIGREILQFEEIGATEQPVDMELVNGDRIVGKLLVEGDEAHRRVSDYLNSVANRFVLVRTKEGATYVNRSAISQVHLEEAP